MSPDQEYRIFYHCAETGDDAPSDEAVAYPLDTIIDMAMQLVREDGDFLGVLDGSGKCVQFISTGAGLVEVDIPDPAKRGSHKKSITESALENQVKSLASLFHGKLDGFTFTPW